MLNALRHQWYFHDRDEDGCWCKDWVLNALRHQWYFHQQLKAMNDRLIECSTPYGINGIFTSRSRQLRAGAAVLNALRHQWYFHTILSVFCSLVVCVLNALRHQWYFHPLIPGP